MLSGEEEAIVVAFRRHTLLSLDDCLYALQPTIPHLTRSSLHRCLQRHGIGRLADIEGDKPREEQVQVLSDRLLPHRHRRSADRRRKALPFVAIDRTSKFAFVQLVEKANRVTASAFLVALVEAVPYKIHTVLTDNGIQFRLPPRHANGPTARYTTHMFDLRCREHGIDRRWSAEPCPGSFAAARSAVVRSVAISASSRAFDLKGETKMARTNQRSPITRSAYAIRPPPQRAEVLGTHR